MVKNFVVGSMKLVPFGIAGDEPLGFVEGFHMGVREAVWRGFLSLDQGKEIYPEGDWSVIENG